MTLNKFMELVKKRKELGGTGTVKTIETKRAMQRALQPEAPEPPEVEEEEEEEVYTIEQHGKQIEFKLGAACQVLYDDGIWYPGAVCSYTETTHKFRFKLTEVLPPPSAILAHLNLPCCCAACRHAPRVMRRLERGLAACLSARLLRGCAARKGRDKGHCSTPICSRMCVTHHTDPFYGCLACCRVCVPGFQHALCRVAS